MLNELIADLKKDVADLTKAAARNEYKALQFLSVAMQKLKILENAQAELNKVRA